MGKNLTLYKCCSARQYFTGIEIYKYFDDHTCCTYSVNKQAGEMCVLWGTTQYTTLSTTIHLSYASNANLFMLNMSSPLRFNAIESGDW